MTAQAHDQNGVVVPGALPVGRTSVLIAADGVPVTLDQPLDPRTRFVTIVNGYSGSIVAYAWHFYGDDGEDPAAAMPLDQLPEDAPILLPGRNLLPVPHELRGAEATLTFEYTSGEAGSATIYVAEHFEPAVLDAPEPAE